MVVWRSKCGDFVARHTGILTLGEVSRLPLIKVEAGGLHCPILQYSRVVLKGDSPFCVGRKVEGITRARDPINF